MNAKSIEPLGNANLVGARKRDAFALRPIAERRIVDVDGPAHWASQETKTNRAGGQALCFRARAHMPAIRLQGGMPVVKVSRRVVRP